eukprot:10777103-Ditylum_brightwellii.AAC.1
MIPWPNQAMPPSSCWITWRKFLKKCFALATKKGHRLHHPIPLHQPLGEWTAKTPYTTREYYYSLTQDKVYKLHHGSFSIYTALTGRITWFQITPQSCIKLPSDAMFCTVRKFGSTIYCKALLARADQLNTIIVTNRSISQTFETFLSGLPAHVRQLLGNLKTEEVDVGYWIEAINT